MTTEEKFNAAVNVIKGLPKNGSYQPSHDLMLRFYSFYKQATLGPCGGARPGFWDVVGRAKYDAWKSLGDMPSNEAMKRYVDELHSIVETMSYSDKVASFLNAPTGNISDLELVAGDIIQKVRSRSNSPKQSPPQANELNGRSDSYDEDSPYPSESDSDRTDDGDYVDTIEAPEPRRLIPNGHCAQPPPTTNGYAPVKSKKPSRTASADVSQEVARTVQNLQSDVESLKVKVTVLESAEDNRKIRRRKNWWAEVNPRLMVFIVVWPLIVNLVLSRVFNRNRVS